SADRRHPISPYREGGRRPVPGTGEPHAWDNRRLRFRTLGAYRMERAGATTTSRPANRFQRYDIYTRHNREHNTDAKATTPGTNANPATAICDSGEGDAGKLRTPQTRIPGMPKV